MTRNVNKDHLYEIFGLFGPLKNVDLPTDRIHGHHRGFAYVEFETDNDAEKALEHMDGGQIDGQDITVAPVLLANPRIRPQWNKSPMRRGGRFPQWRRRPMPFRPQGDRRRRPFSPMRQRSPRRRTRSRSPTKRRRHRSSSASSH